MVEEIVESAHFHGAAFTSDAVKEAPRQSTLLKVEAVPSLNSCVCKRPFVDQRGLYGVLLVSSTYLLPIYRRAATRKGARSRRALH
eukprot:1895026-Amphidinium_carterae.5